MKTMTIDPRRVALSAILIALVGIFAGRALLRDAVRQPALQPEETPAPLPTTDVSQYHARIFVAGYRDGIADVLDEDGELLFDRCGRFGIAPDELRLTWLDAWGRDSFTVGVVARGERVEATWKHVGLAPPPPEPPPLSRDGRHRAQQEPATSYVNSGAYQVLATSTRPLDAAQWRRALAAVREREFVALQPSGERGKDGGVAIIESCIEGRYHLVDRFSPHAPDQRAFLRTARSIEFAAGAVYAMPVMLTGRDVGAEPQR